VTRRCFSTVLSARCAGKKRYENGNRAEAAPEIVDGTGDGEAVTVFDRGPIRKNKCECPRTSLASGQNA
jgi:hypothetical protein